MNITIGHGKAVHVRAGDTVNIALCGSGRSRGVRGHSGVTVTKDDVTCKNCKRMVIAQAHEEAIIEDGDRREAVAVAAAGRTARRLPGADLVQAVKLANSAAIREVFHNEIDRREQSDRRYELPADDMDEIGRTAEINAGTPVRMPVTATVGYGKIVHVQADPSPQPSAVLCGAEKSAGATPWPVRPDSRPADCRTCLVVADPEPSHWSDAAFAKADAETERLDATGPHTYRAGSLAACSVCQENQRHPIHNSQTPALECQPPCAHCEVSDADDWCRNRRCVGLAGHSHRIGASVCVDGPVRATDPEQAVRASAAYQIGLYGKPLAEFSVAVLRRLYDDAHSDRPAFRRGLVDEMERRRARAERDEQDARRGAELNAAARERARRAEHQTPGVHRVHEDLTRGIHQVSGIVHPGTDPKECRVCLRSAVLDVWAVLGNPGAHPVENLPFMLRDTLKRHGVV